MIADPVLPSSVVVEPQRCDDAAPSKRLVWVLLEGELKILGNVSAVLKGLLQDRLGSWPDKREHPSPGIGEIVKRRPTHCWMAVAEDPPVSMLPFVKTNTAFQFIDDGSVSQHEVVRSTLVMRPPRVHGLVFPLHLNDLRDAESRVGIVDHEGVTRAHEHEVGIAAPVCDEFRKLSQFSGGER